jgi:hypothetical protein
VRASSEDQRKGAVTVPPERLPESWFESIMLLPRRGLFLVVAVVQIAVELVATALREAFSVTDER